MKHFAALLSLAVILTLTPVGAQTSPPRTAPPSASAPDTPAPSDTALNTRLERIFAAVPAFEGLEASVTEGVVRLSGTVPTAESRADVLELVEGLDGVLYVVDATEQDTAVNKTLSPAVVKLRDYVSRTLAFLPLLGLALIILLVFWILSNAVGTWRAPYRRMKVDPLLQSFLSQFLRAAVLLIGVLIALDLLGATPFVAALLGTAGLAGLAVGFAFRDIVENYLAGILMSLRQPFQQNDLIRVGEHEGVVARLTARELLLLTLEGNHVRVPNATVFKSEIVNYTRNPRRRFDVEVGVDVNEDLSSVQTLGTETLRAMRGVLDDPAPSSRVERLGDFNVIVRFYGWVDQLEADFLKVSSQAVRLLKEAFDEAGVLMPEPITNVRLQEVPPGVPLSEDEGEQPGRSAERQLPARTQAAAKAIDVSVDRQLEDQLREESARTGEENLLEETAQPP